MNAKNVKHRLKETLTKRQEKKMSTQQDSQLQNLKNKLVDIGGSTKNMSHLFFPNEPAHSSPENIYNALGHWPEHAVTMIGMLGLNNIEQVMNTILTENIEGDILEAGVWRGGASIFINKILQSRGATNRLVYVCDSFEGLPTPQTERFDKDAGDTHHIKNAYLGVSLEQVQKNFKDYETLTDNVVFLKGWFKDTLSNPRIEKLALLRMDGDMYSSTMDILNNLYHKVVPGGFIIIDDYGLGCCKAAIHDWFGSRGIALDIKMVNHSIAYFRK
jgi:O-methyltransferase